MSINPKLIAAIHALCNKAEEVSNNGDWPTEDGTWTDDGITCTSVINDLIQEIRGGLQEL